MFALFPEFGARTRPKDLWPFLISETGQKFLIWTQGKIHLGNRANLVNRAYMKRPLENVVGRQKTNWDVDEGSGEVEIWASVLS